MGIEMFYYCCEYDSELLEVSGGMIYQSWTNLPLFVVSE